MVATAPATRKHGNIDVDSTVERAKKSVVANFDSSVPKPMNVMSRNAAYDTREVLKAAQKSTTTAKPAQRSRGAARPTRPDLVWDEARVTHTGSARRNAQGGAPLTEGRDASAVESMPMETGVVARSAAVADADLSSEAVYDDWGDRANHNAAAYATQGRQRSGGAGRGGRAGGGSGQPDPSEARGRGRTLDRPPAGLRPGEAGSEPAALGERGPGVGRIVRQPAPRSGTPGTPSTLGP